jgi:predicted ester cyclase
MERPMTVISGQALADRVRRLIEQGIGHADHALIDELIAPGGVEHQRGHDQGIEAVHNLAASIHEQFRDLTITVEASAVEGEMVWTRARVRGTNTGPVMGHEPTGRPIAIDLFDVARMKDGRVVEHWGLADQLGMMIQLGHIGAPAPYVAAASASASRAAAAGDN